MTINFKLEPVKPVDPAQDDMSRAWIGYSPTHTDQQTFDQNRGVWALGPRAARERYATFSVDGVIKLVAAIERIEIVPAKDPRKRPKSAIVGTLLAAGDPTFDALIGQTVDGHRNPVTYLLDPEAGERICLCGCGVPVSAHREFLPGHDQRAVHDRIARQWGGTAGFIKWFDSTYRISTH